MESLKNFTDYSKNSSEGITDTLPNQQVSVNDYQKIIMANKEEIKNLRLRINEYENSKAVLSDDITARISKLPYHKKIMLHAILKNIMDMVESV